MSVREEKQNIAGFHRMKYQKYEESIKMTDKDVSLFFGGMAVGMILVEILLSL